MGDKEADNLIIIPEGHRGLPLAGWDDYSIWGLDLMEPTFGLYAQLQRNEDDPDGDLRHWPIGFPSLFTLWIAITMKTGCRAVDVATALLESLNFGRRYEGLPEYTIDDLLREDPLVCKVA